MKHLSTGPGIFALTIIFAFIIGCKLGSASSETNQNSQHDGPATPPTELAKSPESNATNASPTPTPAPPPNAVCPDPAKPCQNKTIPFDDWALSFKLPAKPQPNKTYRSAQFYGIILKTYKLGDNEDCDGGEYIEALENERKQLQHENPDRKVFADYECPNMGAASYDFPGKMDAKKENDLIPNFIAIYGGPKKEDAENLLPKFKVKYPNAVVKPITVSAELIDQ